jgi:hypothetical protein
MRPAVLVSDKGCRCLRDQSRVTSPLRIALHTGRHRELRCVEHLSKYKQCPNTPETAQKRDYGNLQQSTVSFRPFPPECRSNSRGVAGDDEIDGISRNVGGARVRLRQIGSEGSGRIRGPRTRRGTKYFRG